MWTCACRLFPGKLSAEWHWICLTILQSVEKILENAPNQRLMQKKTWIKADKSESSGKNIVTTVAELKKFPFIISQLTFNKIQEIKVNFYAILI